MVPVATPAPSRARPPRVTSTPAPIEEDVPPAPEAGTVAAAAEVAVGVAAAVAVGVAVGSDAVVMQAEALMVSLMRVTSPVLAITRPSTVTPEPRVIEVEAMTVPAKVDPSSVAELPTCQNTLHAEPPLMMLTDELLAVVRVLPI